MNHIITAVIVLVVIMIGVFIWQPTERVELQAPLFDNLGDHHFPIITKVKLAQRFFDQGLILTYGFNHEEASRSFKEAARLDPKCAMCYWGAAYVLGPNINLPMDPGLGFDAYTLAQEALQLAPTASKREQAYIEALAKRYAPAAPADRSSLDLDYANAMREVSQQFPDDMDAATLFAEALMDLTPWAYWTTDGQPTTYSSEIVSTLESVLQRAPNHPGANHFYIHAVEASLDPGRAVPSAERLPSLVPGAGHLVHMPAHTYWRVGRYHDAAVANEHAIHADEAYMPDRRTTPGFYPTAYYPHNIHFLFHAAAMEGNSQVALQAADKLVDEIPQSNYAAFPMLEDFKPMPLFAMVRFGKWDDILRQPKPDAKYQYTTGIWRYARGLALVRLGQLDEAAAELSQMESIAALPEMEALILSSFNPAATMLKIGALTLSAELAGANGQSDEMINRLQEAVALQDTLPYIEPPAWYYPVRQTLGAALLKLGRAPEAEAVYREDLRQYPENGWSLFGLWQSLEAQGASEAAQVQARFEAAWAHADVTLTASQF